MYFPDDMTFQYFFFDTYPGYFLQALPFAIIAGVIYGIIRHHQNAALSKSKRFWSVLFVCYLTGLICLVLALDVMGIIWYRLLYHMPSGLVIRMFAWDCNFVPDFFTHINSEMIANVLVYLPFGILYPLSKQEVTWKKTMLVGFLWIVGIEVLQPVFGRAFDVNDICLNMIGLIISSLLFFMCKRIVKGKMKN